MHFRDESRNEDELVLDLAWNEVCDTLIAQTDEHELQDWEMTTTHEEVSEEEITITETDDLLFGQGLDSDDQVWCACGGETNAGKIFNENQAIYPVARVTLGAVMVLLTLFTIKHDLTGQAMTNLLQLLTLVLLSGHILPDTL